MWTHSILFVLTLRHNRPNPPKRCVLPQIHAAQITFHATCIKVRASGSVSFLKRDHFIPHSVFSQKPVGGKADTKQMLTATNTKMKTPIWYTTLDCMPVYRGLRKHDNGQLYETYTVEETYMATARSPEIPVMIIYQTKQCHIPEGHKSLQQRKPQTCSTIWIF